MKMVGVCPAKWFSSFVSPPCLFPRRVDTGMPGRQETARCFRIISCREGSVRALDATDAGKAGLLFAAGDDEDHLVEGEAFPGDFQEPGGGARLDAFQGAEVEREVEAVLQVVS